MLKTYLQSYLRHIPLLAGVEATFTEGEPALQLVILKQKGNTVEVIRREAGIATVGKLLSFLPKDVPIVLTLNGKGLIHRFVEQEGLKEGADLLRHVLPNAKKQDFYLQCYRQQHTAILSVIRRERLEELMNFFSPLSDRILSISLGPFNLIPLLPALHKEPAEWLILGHHRFGIAKGEFISYQWEEELHSNTIICIGQEEMNEQFIVAFSLGFLVMSGLPLITLPLAGKQDSLAEKQQQWLFKRSATLLGAFFLMVLLLNTYYFMHYSGLLAATPTTDEAALTKEIAQLSEVLKGQERLVEIIHYVDRTGKAPLSYMADQLGASVPKAISLDELHFFPKDEAISRKERKPVYQAGVVHIIGSTTNLGTLNHWVKTLGLLDAVHDVSLVNYTYDEKSERGVFNLNLILQP